MNPGQKLILAVPCWDAKGGEETLARKKAKTKRKKTAGAGVEPITGDKRG